VTAQAIPGRTWPELAAETQRRADAGLYPLGGMKPADVHEALTHITSLDRDEWAAAFSAIGDRYATRAKSEEAANPKAAEADWLDAWHTYNFARWPVPNSPGKQAAYDKSLTAFLAAARHMTPKLSVVRIPFEGHEIIGYLRLPRSPRPSPVVLMIGALDSRKEEAAVAASGYLAHGIGVFAVDMPGTGQAPIKVDVGAERMFTPILDWLGKQKSVDASRIIVSGTSWSGYWAAKLAYLEPARLRGAVVQGGPIHDYFQPAWQQKALGTPEYLFDLFPARASIYGVTTLPDFLAYGPRLSLLDAGLLDKPSAPMLVLNGEKDSQVPIADLYLLLHHGDAKDAWVNPTGGHTGRNAAWGEDRIFTDVVLPWVQTRLR